MLKKLQLFLAGKKTYLACLGLIIAALAEYSNDGDLIKLINKIFEALAIIGLRLGVSK